MLMKALLNRINGGADTSSARASSSQRRLSRLTYQKYPNLPDLTLRLICLGPDRYQPDGTSAAAQAQKVFPAIEIVERFGLPTDHRDDIKKAMIHHLEGPVWAIRDKAAKALSSIADRNDFVDEISRMMSSNWCSQNALHGRLLYLRWLTRRFRSLLFIEMNGT